MPRTKSRPDIDAITSVGVTPYSTSEAAGLSGMEDASYGLWRSANELRRNEYCFRQI